MRTRMQLLIIVVLLAAIAVLAVCAVRLGGQAGARDSGESSGNSTELTSEEWALLDAADAPDEDYMDRYGSPEEAFFELNIADGVQESLDFDSINSLMVYEAQPSYAEDGLLQQLATLFYDSPDGYRVTKQPYSVSSDGCVVGWGNYYWYLDTTDWFLEGSAYSSSYMARDVKLPVSEEGQEAFVRDLVDRFQLGFRDNGEVWISEVEREQSLKTTTYTLRMTVDGIGIDERIAGPGNLSDADGARYMGWPDTYAVFDAEGLKEISSMYAGTVTGERVPGVYWEGLEDVRKAVEKAYISDDAVANVYDITDAHVAYSVGYCEDGTFLITPWLVLGCSHGSCLLESGTWQRYQEEVYLNLDTGSAYGGSFLG